MVYFTLFDLVRSRWVAYVARAVDLGGVGDRVKVKRAKKPAVKKGQKTCDRSLLAPFKRLPKIGRKDSWAKRLAENSW